MPEIGWFGFGVGLVWFGLDWARLRMVGHGCVALGSTALGWVLLELAGIGRAALI